MVSLIIYGTEGCHLCEQALALVTPLISHPYTITEIDISEDDVLIELYGVRIPVIQRLDNNAELSWPFDAEQFLAFIT